MTFSYSSLSKAPRRKRSKTCCQAFSVSSSMNCGAKCVNRAAISYAASGERSHRTVFALAFKFTFFFKRAAFLMLAMKTPIHRKTQAARLSGVGRWISFQRALDTGRWTLPLVHALLPK